MLSAMDRNHCPRSIGNPVRDHRNPHIVKLLMLTGQRRGKIAALRPSYVDLKEGTICLPSSLTKNGRTHLLPIGAMAAAELLKADAHVLTCALMFRARGRANSPFSG